jgi:hypothetical protein
MRYPGFVGVSNAAPSLLADCERSVNLYPATVDSQYAPTGQALLSTPGLGTFYASTDINGRAAFAVEGRCFVVIGTSFLEITSTQSATLRGSVAQDSNPATICYNGKSGGQLLVTSGTHGYCYNMTSHAFTQVLTGTATQGGALNTRFLAFDVATGRVAFSALNDGTSWDPTDFFARGQAPDPWRSMVIRTPEIWLIGEQSGEVWYDSGAYPTPFQPISGATFEYGTPATFSVIKAGDYIMWLSQDNQGGGSIVAAKGFGPQVVSSYAVSHALSGYRRDNTIDDCEALVYQQDGHEFACFSFPTAGATWCADMSNMAWHERGVWDVTGNQYRIWAPRAHCYAFGKNLVVSRGSAVVAQMDTAYCTEVDGSAIRRLRIPPPLWAKSGERLVVDRFQVIAEPGLGLTTGYGSDPMLMMRASYDAKTWGSERSASVGKLGEYAKRCVFTRCGSSELLWVPEIVFTSPIPLRVCAAEINATGVAAKEAA